MSESFWVIFGLSWTALCIGFWTFIIRLIIKKVKKRKNKKINEVKATEKKSDDTKQKTQDRFQDFIDLYTDSSFFDDAYTTALETQKVDKQNLITIVNEIEMLKTKFSTALNKLTIASDKNICLFSKEKFDAITPPPTGDELSKNIIDVLPILGEFFEIHHQLYEVTYMQVLTERVFPINRQFLGVLYEDPSAFRDHEETRAKLTTYVKILYDAVKGNFVKTVCEGQADVERLVLSYIEESEFEEKMVDRFLKIYLSKMREAILPFTEAHTNLYTFFNEKEEEIKASLPWLSFNFISLPNSSLHLVGNTKEECLRVMELYMSGKMTGRYSAFIERKSLEG